MSGRVGRGGHPIEHSGTFAGVLHPSSVPAYPSQAHSDQQGHTIDATSPFSNQCILILIHGDACVQPEDVEARKASWQQIVQGQDRSQLAQLLQTHGVLVKGGQQQAAELLDALLVRGTFSASSLALHVAASQDAEMWCCGS